MSRVSNLRLLLFGLLQAESCVGDMLDDIPKTLQKDAIFLRNIAVKWAQHVR